MTWSKSPAGSGTTAVDADGSGDTGQARLGELGYKQELKRDLSLLSNFAFSFTIISVLTGVTTLYNTGLNFGGPATMTFGWFVAGAFTMTVGLSMAEICSSFPTSGGLYYWSARLSGNRWSPFASWITGWYATQSHTHSTQIFLVFCYLSMFSNVYRFLLWLGSCGREERKERIMSRVNEPLSVCFLFVSCDIKLVRAKFLHLFLLCFFFFRLSFFFFLQNE